MIGVMVPNVFAQIYSNEDFPVISEYPDNYVNSWLKVSGTVLNTQDFGSSKFYVFTVGGQENNGRDSLGVRDYNSNLSVSIDDCFIFEGKMTGSTELSNAMDMSWDVPEIELEKYQKIDCLEAKYPVLSENDIYKEKTLVVLEQLR